MANEFTLARPFPMSTVGASVFRGYLIMADSSRCDWMHALANETGQMSLQLSLDRYPTASELRQHARQLDPDFVILDFLYPEVACGIVASMQPVWPRCTWIGVDGGSGACPASMGFPGTIGELERCLFQGVHAAAPLKGGARVYAFVPAKAGSGASTVAWNTALAAQKAQGGKVLLMEADLRAGAMSYLLKPPPAGSTHGSTQLALQAANEGDEHAARMSLIGLDGVDVLVSSREAMDPVPRWDAFYHLLAIMRPRYDLILVDLPEIVNPGSSELVRSAGIVFVVSTPELLPLKLAEDRCRDLENWGVPAEHVRLLLNRTQRSELSAKDVEENLRRPVAESFPNDYYGVRKSILECRGVAEDTALGRAFQHFAATLQPFASAKPPQSAAGLLSYLKRLR